MFKNSTLRVINSPLRLRLGTSGLFTFSTQRFEFVYLRIMKKMVSSSYMKRSMRFSVCKFWLLLKPNCMLSCKSTNARMGAGVGSLVRLSMSLSSFTSFVEFKNYSSLFLSKIKKYTSFKLPIKFFSWQPCSHCMNFLLAPMSLM